MLTVNLNEDEGIVLLEPKGALSKEDFTLVASTVDPYIEKSGKLNGVLIHTKSFPGWDSFGALIKHLSFVKDHHKKVRCVALVTDSAIGGFAEHVASHFISAEVKHFAYDQMYDARNWIRRTTSIHASTA
jgi:hypothetical protein